MLSILLARAHLQQVLRDLVRIVGVVRRDLGGAAEEEAGQMKHAVLVELGQGPARVELDVDSPSEHFYLPRVVSLL